MDEHRTGVAHGMAASRRPLTRRLSREHGPLHRQATAQLRGAIIQGRLALGAELPKEAELAAGFGVSLITVRHALRELEAEGLIRKRPAKAAIVISATPHLPAPRPLNSLEDVVNATQGARLAIASYRPRRSPEAAEAFGLDPALPLPCLRGRLVAGRTPLSEITIYFPPAIGERLSRADFDDVVVFRSVERRLGIRLTGARITVTAERADAALARALEAEEGDPMLVSRMLWRGEDGAPVELTIARHRADRYSLSYEFP
jgi:GntR family transcriptional regulator